MLRGDRRDEILHLDLCLFIRREEGNSPDARYKVFTFCKENTEFQRKCKRFIEKYAGIGKIDVLLAFNSRQ